MIDAMVVTLSHMQVMFVVIFIAIRRYRV